MTVTVPVRLRATEHATCTSERGPLIGAPRYSAECVTCGASTPDVFHTRREALDALEHRADSEA
jgi:hypothetical protein